MKNDPLIIDLTPKVLEASRGYPKKFGRYSCSMLYNMLEASKIPWGIPPAKYFDIEDIDFSSAMRMIKGIQTHELVQKYLPKERNEIKFEYDYIVDGEKKFTVVGKVDHLPDDSVWEFKTSENIFAKSKDYHDHQAKLYCTICNRPEAFIFQPLETDNSLILKEIGHVLRDDAWFESEMKRLLNYHERLALLMKENN